MIPKSTSDWRLQGQEKYLQGAVLLHRQYRRYQKNPNWDHDHCEFCQVKFMVEGSEKVLSEGYCTEDEYHWICEKCFQDFKEKFAWKIKN